MFTPQEREQVRERVFELARADPRVSGGALTGSTAEVVAGRGIRTLHLSMSHDAGLAIAYVIADGEPGPAEPAPAEHASASAPAEHASASAPAEPASASEPVEPRT